MEALVDIGRVMISHTHKKGVNAMRLMHGIQRSKSFCDLEIKGVL